MCLFVICIPRKCGKHTFMTLKMGHLHIHTFIRNERFAGHRKLAMGDLTWRSESRVGRCLGLMSPKFGALEMKWSEKHGWGDIQWEISRILKWRYVSTICLAIFCGDIPWNLGLKNRPYIWNRYLHFRILKFPLICSNPCFSDLSNSAYLGYYGYCCGRERWPFGNFSHGGNFARFFRWEHVGFQPGRMDVRSVIWLEYAGS